MLNQQQLLPKPAAAAAGVAAAITLGFPYCKRCLSFTYFGFGMGFGFGSGFGQPPGREEIKIYIAYKAGQLLLARQGILLFSMFLNLASFTSIRSILWFVFFAASFHLKLAAAKAESVAAIKLPIDHLSASIAAKEAQEKIYDCCQVVANGFELG